MKQKAQTLSDYVGARKEQIVAAMSEMAKRYMSPEKVLRQLLLACSRDKKILDCTPESVLRSLVRSAECGLDCSGRDGQGYLVPFKNNRTDTLEAVFMPGYRGLQLNLVRSGAVKLIEASVVYEGEHFVCERGLNSKLEHTPDPEKQPAKTSEIFEAIRCTYAVGVLPDGTRTFEIVWKPELERLRATSKGRDTDFWRLWPDRMCRKAAIRRLCTATPVDSDLIVATLAADAGEPSETEDTEALVEAVTVQFPSETRTGNLAKKMEGKKEAVEQAQPEPPEQAEPEAEPEPKGEVEEVTEEPLEPGSQEPDGEPQEPEMPAAGQRKPAKAAMAPKGELKAKAPGKTGTPKGMCADLIQRFAALDVSEAELVEYMERDVDRWDERDISRLTNISDAMEQGDMTWQDVKTFKVRAVERAKNKPQ